MLFPLILFHHRLPRPRRGVSFPAVAADAVETASTAVAAIIPPAPARMFLRVIDMLTAPLSAERLYTTLPLELKPPGKLQDTWARITLDLPECAV